MHKGTRGEKEESRGSVFFFPFSPFNPAAMGMLRIVFLPPSFFPFPWDLSPPCEKEQGNPPCTFSSFFFSFSPLGSAMSNKKGRGFCYLSPPVPLRNIVSMMAREFCPLAPSPIPFPPLLLLCAQCIIAVIKVRPFPPPHSARSSRAPFFLPPFLGARGKRTLLFFFLSFRRRHYAVTRDVFGRGRPTFFPFFRCGGFDFPLSERSPCRRGNDPPSFFPWSRIRKVCCF